MEFIVYCCGKVQKIKMDIGFQQDNSSFVRLGGDLEMKLMIIWALKFFFCFTCSGL